MNRIFYAAVISIVLLMHSSYAQNTAASNRSITISGSRFTYDLLRQWIQNFNEDNPDVVIQIVPRETPYAEQATLVINAHNLDSLERRDGYEYIQLGRYVILPIANENSIVARQYKNKPIRQQELKELYFDAALDRDDLGETALSGRKNKKPVIQLYTRQRIACANTAFASYYGFKAAQIKGKAIEGEDKHLVYAVSKDTAGVSYSIPGILYDLQTRKLKRGITIIKTENIAEEVAKHQLDISNLDSLTRYLESHTATLDIPLTYFHISLKKDASPQSAERRFINYILTTGQAELHKFGYLKPEEDIRNRSIEVVNF